MRTIEEGWPATARVELVVRLVQRCVTGAASVHALLFGVLELAAAGGLGALLAEDAELLLGEDSAPLVVGLLDGLDVGHVVRRSSSRERKAECEYGSGGGGSSTGE